MCVPLVLVDTTGLSREDWLAYRRQGIGGSDAAAVLGISPFRTAVDLYYDKLNRPIEDDGSSWVAMEVGTLLEDLVARIFAKKTGLKVYRRKCMFQHPDYPWMLADLDYLVEMPDGSTAILECKTTNYNARDKWEYDGKPIVPVYYEVQGRHYPGADLPGPPGEALTAQPVQPFHGPRLFQRHGALPKALFPDVKPLISAGCGEQSIQRVMEEHGIPAVAEVPDSSEPVFIPSACWRNIAPGILSTTRFTGMVLGGKDAKIICILDFDESRQIKSIT